MREEWKEIKGFPKYSVSNLGKIKNNETGKILKPYRVGGAGNQYPAVDLYPKKHIKVHRIVALHFIPNPENKREVNHKDGDHFNSSAENLEWVTGSENCKHAYKELGKVRLSGSKNPNARRILRVEDGKTFGSLQEATKAIGLKAHTSISKALKKENLTAGGYHWKYD